MTNNVWHCLCSAWKNTGACSISALSCHTASCMWQRIRPRFEGQDRGRSCHKTPVSDPKTDTDTDSQSIHFDDDWQRECARSENSVSILYSSYNRNSKALFARMYVWCTILNLVLHQPIYPSFVTYVTVRVTWYKAEKALSKYPIIATVIWTSYKELLFIKTVTTLFKVV